MSPNIILNYLSHLSAAFFIHQARRSVLSGKRIFEVNEKYYFEDIGLRHAMFGYRQIDIGKIIENLAHNHLRFLGYNVTVGKIGDKEIDFICEKAGNRLYVQTAYLLPNDKVKEREFGNLLAVKDSYPKIVVSLDKDAGGNYLGVEHWNLLDFLSSDNLSR